MEGQRSEKVQRIIDDTITMVKSFQVGDSLADMWWEYAEDTKTLQAPEFGTFFAELLQDPDTRRKAEAIVSKLHVVAEADM